ncbi:MAG: hypothetical protein QOE71_68 [Pseudonocardiales bacterium]|nr:hypothetical protein [Pseudonocardiales bacterium]
MTEGQRSRGAVGDEQWPALPLADWHETRDTLQLWTQIIGKVRMVNTPVLNHWWNVPLYVSATGLTTSLIPHPSGNSFQADFDLQAHRLEIVTVSGGRRSIPLQSGPVADFYGEVMHHLAELGVGTTIWPMPVEIDNAIPMDADLVHTVYDAEHAHRFWRALVQMVRVFEHFRSGFVGKSSPVQLFWGGLDLATTRFSGRAAPPHPGGAPNCGPHVMLEAYSHEVSSLGYWPGGGGEGLFYSYAYPQPDGYKAARVRPRQAFWNDEMAEFVLPYEQVRSAGNPERTLLEFAQTTYEAAADAADWDRTRLERPTAQNQLTHIE